MIGVISVAPDAGGVCGEHPTICVSETLEGVREKTRFSVLEKRGGWSTRVYLLCQKIGAKVSMPQLSSACLKVAFDGLHSHAKITLCHFRCPGPGLSTPHLLRRFLSRLGHCVRLLSKTSVDLLELLCPPTTGLLSLKEREACSFVPGCVKV